MQIRICILKSACADSQVKLTFDLMMKSERFASWCKCKCRTDWPLFECFDWLQHGNCTNDPVQLQPTFLNTAYGNKPSACNRCDCCRPWCWRWRWRISRANMFPIVRSTGLDRLFPALRALQFFTCPLASYPTFTYCFTTVRLLRVCLSLKTCPRPRFRFWHFPVFSSTSLSVLVACRTFG